MGSIEVTNVCDWPKMPERFSGEIVCVGKMYSSIVGEGAFDVYGKEVLLQERDNPLYQNGNVIREGEIVHFAVYLDSKGRPMAHNARTQEVEQRWLDIYNSSSGG